MSDNPNRALGILAGVSENKLFVEGTWNADFAEPMRPKEGDLVVTGKKGLDAFPGTDLEQLLVANGIKTVVLGGFLTNCCVESTMRTAYEKGFNVCTLTDCTAATSEEAQSAATGGTYGMFSKPMTKDEFIAELRK
jgi:nicotinamidase-related amidase